MKRLVSLILIVLVVITTSKTSVAVYASDSNKLAEYIDESIEKEKASTLSPFHQKLYEKAVEIYKAIGSISKEIRAVVKRFEALDENDKAYEQNLEAFFNLYNALPLYKRKIADAITGVIDIKDQLIKSLDHSLVIDIYSTMELNCELSGELQYHVNDEAVAVIKNGVIYPASIGFTSLTISNESEEIVYRLIVKKPLFASSFSVQLSKTVHIPLPSNYAVNEIHFSNKRIQYLPDEKDLTIKGIRKGKAYVYVGTKNGITYKYKVVVK